MVPKPINFRTKRSLTFLIFPIISTPFISIVLFCLFRQYFDCCSFCESKDSEILNFVAIGWFLIALFSLIKYFQIPTIELSNSIFRFKGMHINYDEILNINILTKCHKPFFWTTYQLYGTSILLKSGRTIDLYEDDYLNFQKLRQHLANSHEKNKFIVSDENGNLSLEAKQINRLMEYTILKSNNWKTVSILLIYVLVIAGYAWLKSKVTDVPEAILPISILVISFIVIIQGRESYYIKYSNKDIVFLNSLWFWVRKEFDFKSIRQFEKIYIEKVGAGFRLVDENYKVHNFGCSTIKTENLVELEKIVNERKIHISQHKV